MQGRHASVTQIAKAEAATNLHSNRAEFPAVARSPSCHARCHHDTSKTVVWHEHEHNLFVQKAHRVIQRFDHCDLQRVSIGLSLRGLQQSTCVGRNLQQTCLEMQAYRGTTCLRFTAGLFGLSQSTSSNSVCFDGGHRTGKSAAFQATACWANRYANAHIQAQTTISFIEQKLMIQSWCFGWAC